MGAIAINVGANTNEPGFRGPIHPDGTFTFLPIPEPKPTRKPIPTYGDLDAQLDYTVPKRVHEMPVHLDPEFAEYPYCERYTYGDDHGVKAGPLSSLSAGEYVFFYATLSVTEDAAWLPPVWGAFIIGQLKLDSDPLTGEEYATLDSAEHAPFQNNAHIKRDPVDARVLLLGDPAESRLYDRAVPLSQPTGGVDANWLVTERSADSGKGPWWRRPLGFDDDATAELLDVISKPVDAVNSR